MTKLRETNLVDEAFVRLDKLVVHRVVVRRKRSERVRHVVDTKEYGKEGIGSCPWNFAVVHVGVQKFIFNLVLKALHSRPKA